MIAVILCVVCVLMLPGLILSGMGIDDYGKAKEYPKELAPILTWNYVVGVVYFSSMGLGCVVRLGAQYPAVVMGLGCINGLAGCFMFGYWIYGWVLLYSQTDATLVSSDFRPIAVIKG